MKIEMDYSDFWEIFGEQVGFAGLKPSTILTLNGKKYAVVSFVEDLGNALIPNRKISLGLLSVVYPKIKSQEEKLAEDAVKAAEEALSAAKATLSKIKEK